MTATTAESEAKRCWVLVGDSGAEYDNGEYVEHFSTTDDAAARAEEGFAPGLTPRQLDTPCLTIKCSCCEAIFDEDGEGRELHFASADELGLVVTAYDWTLAEDGVPKCRHCSAGCDCQDDDASPIPH